MEPLASGRTGAPYGLLDEAPSDPGTTRGARHEKVEHERVHAAVPRHVDESDQRRAGSREPSPGCAARPGPATRCPASGGRIPRRAACSNRRRRRRPARGTARPSRHLGTTRRPRGHRTSTTQHGRTTVRRWCSRPHRGRHAANRAPSRRRRSRGPLAGSMALLVTAIAWAVPAGAGSPRVSAHAGAEPDWTVYHGDPLGTGADTSGVTFSSADAGVDVSGSRRPGLRRAARVGRAASSWRRRTTPSTPWPPTPVPSCGPPTSATPVPSGDLPCGDISPTVGITGTPGDRRRPRRDLRRGRRAGRRRAGPLPRRAQHVLRASICSTRPSTRRASRPPTAAAHRAEPRAMATSCSATAATPGTARPTTAGSSPCPRAAALRCYYQAVPTRAATGRRVDGGRRARGRRRRATSGRRPATGRSADALRRQRLGVRAVAQPGPRSSTSPRATGPPTTRTIGISDRPHRRCSRTAPPSRSASRRPAYLLSQAASRRHRRPARVDAVCAAAATPTAATPSWGPWSTSRAATGLAGRADGTSPPCISVLWTDCRAARRPADHGRRARLVDRREHALRHQPGRTAPRCSSSPSAARPTTSRPRRSVTACSWPRAATRSSPSSGSAGLPARRHRRRRAAELVVLAGRVRRRHLHLRQRRLLRLDGRPAAEPADRRHGADAVQEGLLAGGLRRRDLQLRRRRASTARWAASR